VTSALEGVGGQHHAPAALTPGKTRYPLYRRQGGSQGRSGRVRKIAPSPPGFDPRTVQPSRYTDWATRPTVQVWRSSKFQVFVHVLHSCIAPRTAWCDVLKVRTMSLDRHWKVTTISEVRFCEVTQESKTFWIVQYILTEQDSCPHRGSKVLSRHSDDQFRGPK
jgi:hypothetical protein